MTVKTKADGRFEFTPLSIGTYSVVVESSNFKKATTQNIKLDIQQQALVNVVLQTGSVTENVEVTEAPELMQTQSSSVGQVIEEKTIEDLPLNGRDYTMLVFLTPGVTIPQQGARASNQFVANGARVAQNDYSIGEFKMMTSDFPAEFGRAGGAIVNATLKSGTNRLHGSVWEFFRNDALDAHNDYFTPNATQSPKPKLRQNQFGATAGGRIWKDKTFWFEDLTIFE